MSSGLKNLCEIEDKTMRIYLLIFSFNFIIIDITKVGSSAEG